MTHFYLMIAAQLCQQESQENNESLRQRWLAHAHNDSLRRYGLRARRRSTCVETHGPDVHVGQQREKNSAKKTSNPGKMHGFKKAALAIRLFFICGDIPKGRFYTSRAYGSPVLFRFCL
jgi:hypothetical protein